MYKVIGIFRDKTDLDHVYMPGDNFNSDDADRVQDLIKRKLIEGAKNAPSTIKSKQPDKKSKGRD